MTQMQGVVSILRSHNPENTIKGASLRRTLSADMSSLKIPIDSSSCTESDEDECEVTGNGDENPTRSDIWTAIMSQKKEDDSVNVPPPYVHPLVKKSAKSLSEISLEVCTESLGSETGSDVFSPNPCFDEKVVRRTVTTKFERPRSFPPPLPSLAAARNDGASLQMHSRRVNGRLVIEAVSVPPQKYFEAQREDGRFILTLINHPKEQPSENDVVLTSEEEKSIHHDDDIKEKEDESGDKYSTVTSAPLPAPTSVNSYDYYWRAKPTVASVIDGLSSRHRPPTKNRDVVLVRGNKADCLLPSLKGCKEPLMWEPFCIATS